MTLYSDYIDDMGYYIEAMWSKSFWTMTPCNHIDEPLIYEFWMGEYYKVTYDDYLNKDYDESKAYPRPVINLNADVEVSAGDGSSEHPFEIKP